MPQPLGHPALCFLLMAWLTTNWMLYVAWLVVTWFSLDIAKHSFLLPCEEVDMLCSLLLPHELGQLKLRLGVGQIGDPCGMVERSHHMHGSAPLHPVVVVVLCRTCLAAS